MTLEIKVFDEEGNIIEECRAEGFKYTNDQIDQMISLIRQGYRASDASCIIRSKN